MRVSLHITKQNPSSVEQIDIEDVSHLTLDDNEVTVHFNKGDPEHFHLRGNDGQDKADWVNLSLVATRVGLEIDMNS